MMTNKKHTVSIKRNCTQKKYIKNNTLYIKKLLLFLLFHLPDFKIETKNIKNFEMHISKFFRALSLNGKS